MVTLDTRFRSDSRLAPLTIALRARRLRAVVGWLSALSLLGSASSGCTAPPALRAKEKLRLAIVQTGGDVRVTGLQPLRGWGSERDSPFMHVLETVLGGLGRDLGYDELMGLSGLAFRTQFRIGGWDAGSPDPLIGEDCVRPLMAAAGLAFEVYHAPPGDATAAAEARRAIMESIDLGVPVPATNLVPPENWGLVTGYRDGGQTLWCRAYDGGAAGAALDRDVVATHDPTTLVIITRKLPLPDLAVARRASLGRAVDLWERSVAGEYALGRAAFDEWCRLLDEMNDASAMQPNAWTYVSLIDARGAAERYLRGIAPSLGFARGHVERAAAAYARERQVLVAALDAAPFPGPGVAVPDKVRRQRQIDALRQAAALESEAVAALRRAR